MYSFFCFWITFAKMNAQDIFLIQNNKEFVKTALKVFRFQYENNAVYRKFCDFLNIDSGQVKTVEQIPFLPIQFFKSERVLSDKKPVEITFTSSGTTGSQTSSHFITDVSVYEQSFRKGFSEFYGNIENYAVLALLHSYLDRVGSSLIYMVDDLILLINYP